MIFTRNHPVTPKEVINLFDIGYLGVEKDSNYARDLMNKKRNCFSIREYIQKCMITIWIHSIWPKIISISTGFTLVYITQILCNIVCCNNVLPVDLEDLVRRIDLFNGGHALVIATYLRNQIAE
jgi:hypothetical protein